MSFRGQYRARDPRAKRTWWDPVPAREEGLWHTVFYARRDAAKRGLQLLRLRNEEGEIDMAEALARP